MSQESALARRMWHQLEPVHALLYFAPEVLEEAATLGYAVDTRWPSYFAWRTAPLGAAGPHLVSAAFYSFSPRMVARHVPAAWEVARPEEVLRVRLRAMDRVLRGLLGDRVDDKEVAEAAELARRAAEAADTAGRPLAAANADLPWPDEPHLALWQAITILREHRGDGHVAALLTAGLDPCESLVSFAAIGAAPVENFAGRGWSESEWAAAQDRLAARGWVDSEGRATARGHAGRNDVERLTDELAMAPWRALGTEGADRLARLTAPILGAVFESGLLPAQSTLGIANVQAPT
ncbi:SCO6745 family protein [Actinomadura scrupuli]|uniref:SCO6745 family protein n=1 Tax=Actinomadura scrupuli TaxID=559629 RepID=UPI003D9759E3